MILQKRQRNTFDINNTQHVEMFKEFLTKKTWGAQGCPFQLEYPWTSVPDMIKDKLIRRFLNIAT